ncbi:MAG: cryptochrome/photolyase family protein [Planctomyces sp.]|nr:cryptochrome/photolyase family protein [Planctomyces sp.]
MTDPRFQAIRQMRASLIYPHQLYADHPATVGTDRCFLVEDPLYFTEFRFHAKKLILHRASMTQYAEVLRKKGVLVEIVPCRDLSDSGSIADLLKSRGVKAVQFVDPNDNWLEQRLVAALHRCGLHCEMLPDPHFLTSDSVFSEFVGRKKKLFFTDFYVGQRKRLNLLLEQDGKPTGGQWSFDPDNRSKLPKSLAIPETIGVKHGRLISEVTKSIQKDVNPLIGSAEDFRYAIDHDQAMSMYHEFLDQRFHSFGEYEDAIHTTEVFLFHSVLTPSLNIGLISPEQIVAAAMNYRDRVPLKSLEGFIRQVIGWREFIRGIYRRFGTSQRNSNFWNHKRPIPQSFYTGTTGIDPLDTVVQRVLQHGYCHHIERLMVLGNFMMLCDISPDDVYQWFMEHFVDAYDWVMVPNVYGMSQHADGGLMTTKPYISGSAYVLKMSNFRRGHWCSVWDGLYWRFIHRHREFFASNPRMAMMVSQCDRMGEKLTAHLRTAEQFLEQLT